MSAAALAELKAELRDLEGYESDTPFDENFNDEGVNKDFSNVVVVDNLPAVPDSKIAKLTEVVKKIFAGQGTLVEDGIYMPFNNATESTEGFAFIEYQTKEAAAEAVAKLNGALFGKDTLSVMAYEQFLEFSREPDTFTPPPRFEQHSRPDLWYWLADEQCRDEFVIRYSNGEKVTDQETEVLWAETRGAPALDYGGEKQKASGRSWTERVVRWSSQGSYLMTFHPRGCIIWAGRGFKEVMRLDHANVTEALWSPDERYVATWNGRVGNTSPERALVVWDLRTGAEVKAFRQRTPQDGKADFFWSPDSKYLARPSFEPTLGFEIITVYEAPSFKILEGGSIRAPGARDVSFAPARHNMIAWWSPEKDNVPTSVNVMHLPSRRYVRQRQLYSVDSVVFSWHPDGSYLAVRAEKLTRAQQRKKKSGEKTVLGPLDRKQSAGFTIELFRLRERDVSVDVLEVKDRVVDFAWEPVGSRFAVVTGDGPIKYTVGVYAMQERGFAQLFSLEDRQCNQLYWSPRGDFLLLAGMQNLSGHLEFYDVERRKSLATAEHDAANSVSWDPSGRIVCTYKVMPITGATLARDTVGNGYMLWSFQGARIAESSKPKMYQFLWRPRPSTLLSEEEYKDTARNLKKYIAKYQEEDRQRESRKKMLGRLRKRKVRDDFRAFLAEREAEWVANKAMREDGLMGMGEDGSLLNTSGGDLAGAGGADIQLFEDVYEVQLSETVEVVEE